MSYELVAPIKKRRIVKQQKRIVFCKNLLETGQLSAQHWKVFQKFILGLAFACNHKGIVVLVFQKMRMNLHW